MARNNFRTECAWPIWKLWPTRRELAAEEAIDDMLRDLYNGFFEDMPAAPPLASGERLRGWRWKETRKRIFLRDNYTCVYCRATESVLECDHVIPVTRGGSNDDSNLVTACFDCNRSKRCMLVSEWRPHFVLQN